MMLFMPFMVLYLWFACTKKQCQLTSDLSIISLNWRDYYDCTAYEIFAGWVVFHALLGVLPIGRVSIQDLCHFVNQLLSIAILRFTTSLFINVYFPVIAGHRRAGNFLYSYSAL